MPQTDDYPSWVGLIYIFNLIVGTGALTLPAAFAGAGWLFSTFILIVLAFVSFITVTFVIESMACANATIEWRKIQSHRIDESEVTLDSESESDNSTEITAILRPNVRYQYYNINKKVELGEIGALYLNKIGHLFVFVSLCVYLFGDLAIYATATGKTIVNLSCKHVNDTEDFTINCWDSFSITKMNMYRIFVTIFALLVGPFAYFNVQKTKYLQFFTICIRWFAFTVMITLAIIRLRRYGQQGYPGLVNLKEVPALAGSSVYSFMCHHSLPALMAPISDKQHIMRKIGYDFFLICCFYLLLSMTGTFAFKNLDVLYSLNFICAGSGILLEIIGIFLAVFPLFPMSTSFPIIAITLQSNLKSIVLDQTADRYNFFVNRLVFPTVAIVPPVVVALCTHNLKQLVEVTGTYAGVIVQYVIPAVLVLHARRHCIKDFGSSYHKYTSPFQHFFWLLFVILWSIICVIFVTADFIVNNK